MKTKLTLLVLALATVFSCTNAPKETADTIYTNGKIYTVNETQPWAEAVAIKDGKFIKVGTSAEVNALKGDNTQVIDLKGQFAMPGVHDSHVHPSHVYSWDEAGTLSFPESSSKEEILSVLKQYAIDNPDLKIIKGSKWSTGLFPGGRATKEWLDPVFPDRAVILYDESFHNVVVNSAALEMAGITIETPDPEFGTIDRDPANGEATGYLSEEAIGLVAKFVKRPTTEHHYAGLIKSLGQLSAYGTTSFKEMMAGPEALEAYRLLEQKGKLNMRMSIAIVMNDIFTEFSTLEESQDIVDQRDELSSDLIKICTKFFADGTPMSHTSLLLEPYTDDTTSYGKMTMGPKQFELIKQLHKKGLQTCYHATGDGTIRQILDIIEEVQKESPNPDLRHHLGHLNIVNPEDIPRFKSLNVVAEFSPALWYPTSLTMAQEQFIGSERFARFCPIKEFVDAGVIVCWGSDWPAGTPDADPWRSLEAMITRMDPYGQIEGKLGEGIDLETGIKILTINGAKALMQEDITGSIQEGKYADLIVLNHNLFELLVTDIHKTEVQTTLFKGEVVYSKN